MVAAEQQARKVTCTIEDGALTTAPVYENHKRGKNWLAIIGADPQSPGGLERQFVPNGRGRYLYLVNVLKVGEAVEFAADYYSSGGRKHANRWYGVIREKSDTALVVEHFSTSAQAIKAARAATPDRSAERLRDQITEHERWVIAEMRKGEERGARFPRATVIALLEVAEKLLALIDEDGRE